VRVCGNNLSGFVHRDSIRGSALGDEMEKGS